jgi:class 3 adenylate cyclase
MSAPRDPEHRRLATVVDEPENPLEIVERLARVGVTVMIRGRPGRVRVGISGGDVMAREPPE